MIWRSTNTKAALRSRQRGFFMSPYRFAQNPASDPYFSNVALLIHGVDSITDLSSSPKAITSIGGVSASGGSILFGGGYLELANNDDFSLGLLNQPFSIEVDVLTTAVDGIGGILGYSNGLLSNSNYAYALYRLNSGVQLTGVYDNTQSAAGGVGVLTANNFHRIELSYDGVVFREFIDGLLVRSSSPGFPTMNNPVNAMLRIGLFDELTLWSGRMKNIRITKGIARNVSAYTPSSGLFPSA